MEKGRRRHIPAFGQWNQQCEELPITQYFESAIQAGLARAGHYYHDAAGDVLFKASSPPPHKPAKKVRTTSDGMENQAGVGRRRRQGPCVADRVTHAPRQPRVVRPVDEDLYKVPPELLRKKAKGRKNARSLWMGCAGLNCVA